LAHFTEGKIDVIAYGKESGEQLTSGEINTFLKANNGNQPMKKQGPNAWGGGGWSRSGSVSYTGRYGNTYTRSYSGSGGGYHYGGYGGYRYGGWRGGYYGGGGGYYGGGLRPGFVAGYAAGVYNSQY
jgi:hypothetical protein